MKTTVLQTMYEKMQENPAAKKLAAVFSPRRYVPPQGYANPRAYAALQSVICSADTARVGQAIMECRVCGYELARLSVPTYFVAHDFGEAVMRTDPPAGFKVEDIQWPMDAMLFVLPESLSTAVFGRHVPFLSVAKLPNGATNPPDNLKSVIPGLRPIQYPDGGCVMHGVLMLGDMPIDYTTAASNNRLLSEVVKETKFKRDEGYSSQDEKLIDEPPGAPSPQEDVEIVNRMSALAYGLVMAMAACPAFVEKGTMERAERMDKDGAVVKDGLWNPNFVGRTYRHQTDAGDGTHASPRMHWRRGHYRWQRHGEGRKLIRQTWIRPMIVNAETE